RRYVAGNEVQQPTALVRRELATAQTFVGHDAVVLVRAAELEIVGEMAPPWRQVAAHHRIRDDRLRLLRACQRAHQRQPLALLVLEQAGAGERADIGKSRLRPQEGRAQYHLPVDDEAVEREMMAEQLPAPWVARMRLAEQAEDVGPFAQHRGA